MGEAWYIAYLEAESVFLEAHMWISHEGLTYWGTFISLRQMVEAWYFAYLKAESAVLEAHDLLNEWNETVMFGYEWVQQYVTPWKIPLGVLALVLLIWWWGEMETSVTPLVTPEVTPLSSIGSTPPEDLQVVALQHIDSAIKTQAELMERVVQKLTVLEERGRDEEDRQKELELIMKGKLEAQADGQKDLWAKNNQSWDDMRNRLNQFEGILKDDKADSAGGPGVSCRAIQDLKTAGGPSIGANQDSAGGPSGPVKGVLPPLSGEMSVIIKKLTRDLRTPQEIFVESLQEYREEDKEVWATHFPPGYRERMSPQALGEIYATGTAKEWAKGWIKSKELGSCDEARSVIPTCAALDSIFLIDQIKDAINQVNTEKMARKIMGIKAAYKMVSKEEDWKRGSAKGWKSKVDMEMWRRTDPGLNDQEHIFINRKAEDEMRGEMDRDASLMKAKMKLSERSSN